MNAELINQANKRVGDAHILINLISRRVRQLNSGERTRLPELADSPRRGAGDIALLEIIEGRLEFDVPVLLPLTRFNPRNGRKPRGWGSSLPPGEPGV